MNRDYLDKALWLTLIIVAVSALALAPTLRTNSSNLDSLSSAKANDQQLLRSARLSIIQKRYEPVEAFIKSGQHQQALLKLEEISRSYPADPHAFILRGELLFKMGAAAEAAASFAQGVRLEGAYVDRNSPISQREAINNLVESELSRVKSNPGPQSRVNDLRYLQSRLAGGCE